VKLILCERSKRKSRIYRAIKLTLCLTKYHATKSYGGVEV
jgi:hypothetical protein